MVLIYTSGTTDPNAKPLQECLEYNHAVSHLSCSHRQRHSCALLPVGSIAIEDLLTEGLDASDILWVAATAS